MADGEPATKKQKTEEEEKVETEVKAEEEKKEEVKEPEPVKELEEDAPADAKAKVKETASFLVQDTTLNVLPATANNVLMTLTEGGMQHLLAGARANVGLKGGRYMFEVKVVELLTAMEDGMSRAPKPRQLIKVGFSTADASLLLGDSDQSVCFDSEGQFTADKKSTPCSQRFSRDSVVAVLLNLDAKSPNANTVSLFKDGVRVSQPQALPDALKGKPLFPAVTFKGATVHVNFGATCMAPLPFKCRMVQDATAADTAVTKSSAPADGKGEVLLPVSLPDEGTFDWLDAFLAAHPTYTELSDRMILDWAEKSGIFRGKGYASKSCNDKPEFNFGIRELDDGSMRRSILAVASVQQRNYVVMEVRDNLIKEARKETLARFAGFKKVAKVMVGEPTAAFKKKTEEMTLKQKQEASDLAFKLKKAEEKRKKLLEKRQKELEKAKKKAEKEKEKALKKAEAEAKAKEAGEEAPKEDEEMKEEEEEEEKEEVEPEDTEEPPKVTLDAEEKKLWFKKVQIPDLAPFVSNSSFTKFTLPEKDEGFDEVGYEWAKDKKCAEYLKQWVLDRKLTSRVEDLQPSAWFQGKWKDWQTALQKWHAKQNDFKAALAKKAAEKAAKEAKKKKAEEEKAAKEAAKQAAEEAKAKAIAEGQEPPAEEEKKEEEAEPMEVEEKEEEEVVVDFEGVDIFGVKDVMDIGGGMPLFKEFAFEDWTMMQLHFELHLLAHAFKRDVDDPERPGIHLDNLTYYYNKYYKKPLTTKYYGVETWKELADMVQDAVMVTKQSTIESTLDEEMESLQVFVKIAEEARRHRSIQMDLGEESAKLKLQQSGQFNPHQQGPRQPYQQGFKGAGKGGPQQPWGMKGGFQDKGKGKGFEKGFQKGDNRYQPYGGKGVVPPQAGAVRPAYQQGGFKGGYKG